MKNIARINQDETLKKIIEKTDLLLEQSQVGRPT